MLGNPQKIGAFTSKISENRSTGDFAMKKSRVTDSQILATALGCFCGLTPKVSDCEPVGWLAVRSTAQIGAVLLIGAAINTNKHPLTDVGEDAETRMNIECLGDRAGHKRASK